MNLEANDRLENAIKWNNPFALIQSLQAGADPNPESWIESPLHCLMNLGFMHKTRKNNFNGQPVLETVVSPSGRATRLIYPQDEIRRAEIGAHVLIAYGARLDHTSKFAPPFSPNLMNDAILWKDLPFCSGILTSAFYVAIKRQEPLPRPEPDMMIEGLIWQIGPQRDLGKRVEATLKELRNAVTQRLKTPQTPVDAFVAANIKRDDRRYWAPALKKHDHAKIGPTA